MTTYILFATFVAALGSAHTAFGLRVVFAALLPAVFAAVALLYARSQLSIVALVFFVSAIFLAAATLESTAAQSNAPITHRARTVAAESTGQRAARETLFHALGCIGCHRQDATGIGPVLVGLFDRPVTDASCGALTVDEEYLREAILNPSATVAAGFPPVMPSFAGKVTEQELQALTAYVTSLSLRVQ